ncbi:MAG: TetR family transcriptional regulator [Microbacterium sp.]|uniref:TetR/AcrR family transcriptional regulator n=1 Tax=Microbacterium sp. TaxID=51671 RepID=UPI000DB63D8D|nr:TetR/AcrR family transcriptional regulator [Microbacterium sp.]PZU41255.1 MAG: TetR family transcriptional regulator [Microbacterium sp.]
MAQRGSYAKGVAKRDEILRTALEVIAREGFRNTSVRELADAVGLSQAGLLHYFGTKEELYTAILSKRDEVDAATYGPIDSAQQPDAVLETYLDVIRHNADVPGLVQLFAHVSVDAVDPEHPAHDYFAGRQHRLRDLFVPVIERLQQEGRLTTRIDPATLATIVLALGDGLQTQWLVDPELDMAGTIAALLGALEERAE